MTKLRSLFLLLFSKGFYLAVKDSNGDIQQSYHGLQILDAMEIGDLVEELKEDAIRGEENVQAAREIVKQSNNSI